MAIKIENKYGKIEFSEDEFNTEIKKSLFSNKNDKTYKTFKNKTLKDFNFKKTKIKNLLLFGPIILGIIFFFSGFQKKVYTEPWKEEYESKYYVEETTWEERMPGLILVVGGIVLGLYLKKKFKHLDEVTVFSVIWLDGNKQKNDIIFYVDNDFEKEQLSFELNRIKNK